MMRFVALSASVLALAPANTSAQASVFIGGAATFPVGSLTSEGGFAGANTGWQGTIGAQFAVGQSGLTLGPRVYYGSNQHSREGNKSDLLGGAALLNYGFRDPMTLNPFLWAEVGVLSHAFTSASDPNTEATSTSGVVAGGVGLGIPLGGIGAFVAAGYNSGLGGDFDTNFFGLYVGLSIGLGDN
jgi:hypothetical protein